MSRSDKGGGSHSDQIGLEMGSSPSAYGISPARGENRTYAKVSSREEKRTYAKFSQQRLLHKPPGAPLFMPAKEAFYR